MKVAVIETDVYGANGYHTRCLDCGAETKRRDREAAAVRDAKKHTCKKEG